MKQPKLPWALPLDPTKGVYSAQFEPQAPMVYGHKTQSFMKNIGQQKCLDKALLFYSQITRAIGQVEHLHFANIFSWSFHSYDITSLGNIHPITF